MYKKVAVLYDDSREAERALSTAASLAKMFDAELEVIIIRTVPPLYTAYAQAVVPGVGQILAGDRGTFYDALQEKARRVANDLGVELMFHIFESSEHQEVMDLLRVRGSSLLIVGLHHKGLLISRLWRSVYELAEDAPCSVLGVR